MTICHKLLIRDDATGTKIINHRWTQMNTDKKTNRLLTGSYLCLSVSICG